MAAAAGFALAAGAHPQQQRLALGSLLVPPMVGPAQRGPVFAPPQQYPLVQQPLVQPAVQPFAQPAVQPMPQTLLQPVVQPMPQLPVQPLQQPMVPQAPLAPPIPAPLSAPSVAPRSAASPAAKTLLMSPALEKINGHCAQLLQLMSRDGFFRGLQPDIRGEICINVPFCGSLSEAPALSAFVLEDLLPSIPGAQSARLFCADVSLCGTEAMVAMVGADPRLRYDVQHKDLGSEPLPPAALSIGLHPQPLTKTPDRLWERIIANVLRSCERCLFTCWMKSEAEELVRICSSLGSACSLQRNPAPLPEGVTATMDESASMRFHYIVLARQAVHP